MISSSMMSGLLVVGAIIPSTEVSSHNQYNTEGTPVRANKKYIPIRINVKKHK